MSRNQLLRVRIHCSRPCSQPVSKQEKTKITCAWLCRRIRASGLDRKSLATMWTMKFGTTTAAFFLFASCSSSMPLPLIEESLSAAAVVGEGEEGEDDEERGERGERGGEGEEDDEKAVGAGGGEGVVVIAAAVIGGTVEAIEEVAC